MQIEIIIIGAIVMLIMTMGGHIDVNKMVADNQMMFLKFKESDYDFLIRARYGNNANCDLYYNKRIKNAFLAMLLLFMFFISGLNAIKILLIVIGGIFVFKNPYSNLKNYYKRHMHIIDSMLPHYLKNMEILIQHYTVPVAIGKSMSEAPDIFKEGLREMIDSINSGDDSIEPYMNFARKYPVRDSMRMMRLLYRLSLGRQERKQEQILTFSKSISSLQQKARETRYKNRLEKMESKTMSMLIATGIGLMVLLVLSVVQLMGI